MAISVINSPVETYEDVARERESANDLRSAADCLDHTVIELRKEKHTHQLELATIKEEMEISYIDLDGFFICRECSTEKRCDCLAVCIDCFQLICADCMKQCYDCGHGFKCEDCIGEDEDEWVCLLCSRWD